jgi:hypothetical protein
VSIEIVVVFPAPLWPSKAKIYPLNMVMSISFTAIKSPNSFLNPLIFRAPVRFKDSGTSSKFAESTNDYFCTSSPRLDRASFFCYFVFLDLQGKVSDLGTPNSLGAT